MKKLAIITTHPIQYNAPWFQLLAKRKKCEIKVFYTWSQSKDSVKDRTFEKEIKWDIPLLEGYNFEFVDNVSNNPGSHHFFGIDCPTLRSRIIEYQPDALLFFGWNFKSHLLAMRYFKGKIPVWFRGDSTLLDELPNFRTKIRRLVLKKVYSYVDKAFYVGEASKAYFLKHNLQEEQLVYAPHAIDNIRFDDDEVKQYELKSSQWRLKLGIKQDDVVVVFAGKFEIKKQPVFLIEALLAANKKRDRPIKLVMVGNGPLESTILEKIKNENTIHILPFQNQTMMPLVYRLSDIFCLPSKGPGETWGLAINEAMASSRPVIVTDKVGGTKDLLIEGYNGYCFNHQDKQELTSILEKLDKDELIAMRQNAQNHIRNFTMQKIVEALEKNIE